MKTEEKRIIKTGSYAQLRREVEAVLVKGRREMDAMKVRLYWQTGDLIGRYLKANPEENAHGTGTVEKLARDLEMPSNILYRVVRFAASFPNFATWQNLTWSHYRELLTVTDAARRRELVLKANGEKWPVRRLQEAIQKSRLSKKEKAPLQMRGPKEPARGKPGAVQIGWLQGMGETKTKVLDLGFSFYLPAPAKVLASCKTGDWVRFGEGEQLLKLNDEPESHYLYEAFVERVVDGDTLLVHVKMPFNLLRRQYLRFSGLDAPPLKTRQGLRALRYLQKRMLANPQIVFKSRWMDRYDRAISDVWSSGIYLNRELITRGFAAEV